MIFSLLTTPLESGIRPARYEDASSIAALAQRCHEEFLAPLGMDFDLAHATEAVKDLLSGDPDFEGVVLMDSGQCAGYAAGIHASNWIGSSRTMFLGTAWFLRPESRRGSAGIRLLKALIELAAKRSSLMTMAIMETTVPASAKILKRMGFSPFEHNYIKRIA